MLSRPSPARGFGWLAGSPALTAPAPPLVCGRRLAGKWAGAMEQAGRIRGAPDGRGTALWPRSPDHVDAVVAMAPPNPVGRKILPVNRKDLAGV